MRDILMTKRTRRAQVASVLYQKIRSDVVKATMARLIAAGGLTAVDAATFGLFNDVAATDSCSIAVGANTLTSPDNPWTAADVGKAIDVAGAGANGGTLRTAIASYTNAGSVELRDAAETAVAATKTSAGGLAAWGNAPTLTLAAAPQLDAAGAALQSPAPTLPGAPGRQLGATLAALVAAKAPHCHPVVVDLHFNICRGACFAPGEAYAQFTVAAAAAAAASLTFVGAVPVDGQLLAYLATDGTYRTVKVLTVAGQVATLTTTLPAAVAAGANVFAFYLNFSHPSPAGYYAIADATIAGERGSLQWPSYIRSARVSPVAYNSGVVAAWAVNDAALPGSATALDFKVTPGGAGQGCAFTLYPSKSGFGLLRWRMNTKGVAVTVLVNYVAPSGTLSFYNATITTNSAESVEIPVWIPRGTTGALSVIIVRDATALYVGQAEVLQYAGSTVRSLDAGKHVLLGDSWFAQGWLAKRLSARLTNAVIVNKGTGGDTAAMLAARFAADVTPQAPDFVWIMVGTNDAFGAVAPDLFAYYIQQLVAKVQAIGAVPILYTPSVCDLATDANAFDRSRQYAESCQHFQEAMAPQLEAYESGTWTPVPTGLTVVGVGTYTGTWTRIGRRVFASLTVAVAGGTTAATAGGTSWAGLPFAPAANRTCEASDSSITDYGIGIMAPSGVLYPPAWAATAATVTVTTSFDIA